MLHQFFQVKGLLPYVAHIYMRHVHIAYIYAMMHISGHFLRIWTEIELIAQPD